MAHSAIKKAAASSEAAAFLRGLWRHGGLHWALTVLLAVIQDNTRGRPSSRASGAAPDCHRAASTALAVSANSTW